MIEASLNPTRALMPDYVAVGKVSAGLRNARTLWQSGRKGLTSAHNRTRGPQDRPPGTAERMPMFVTPAFAQGAEAAPAGAAFAQFLPIILIFVIFYFLLIRPQQKKMKEHRAMVEALRRGDQIVTSGGIVGKVSKVQEDGMVEVEIAEGVKVKVIKHTITTVLNKTEPAAS
jgi:preprotein translocase subunit YajC